MEIDQRGRIWYISPRTNKRIYTHYKGDWEGFSNCHSLECLIRKLVEFVATGKPTLNVGWTGFELNRPSWLGFRPEDFPAVWAIARPMLTPTAIREVDALLAGKLPEVAAHD